MNGHALLKLAEAWAHVAHDGQSRKGAGEPYIEHPARVADAVWGWRRKALAWLHDVVEDAANPRLMLTALQAMFPADLVNDVLMLSRLPDGWDSRPVDLQGSKEPYMAWILRLSQFGSPDVIAVKLADINDNLKDIREVPDMESQERKYQRAKAVLEDA